MPGTGISRRENIAWLEIGEGTGDSVIGIFRSYIRTQTKKDKERNTMEKADIIIRGKAIFTAHDREPFDGSIAIRGNVILDVCPGDGACRDRCADTHCFYYDDQLIMPGLVDGHQHLWWGAVSISDHVVDITASTSEEEAVAMIREYANSHKDEKRIRGFGWFPANWGDAPLPTKESLDAIVPDRPVYMNCADAHTCWMNSLALEEAGYTPDIELAAGRVGIDENGEMNGLVFEPDALEPAWEKFYDFPDDQIREIVLHYMDMLAAHGVTSVSDMSADKCSSAIHNRYSIFRDLVDSGMFKARVHSFMAFMRETDFSHVRKWQEEFNTEMFRISGVKGFLDGVTSTYTALLLEPYADNPETCGEGAPLDTQESLNASVIATNAAGLPVRIHCVGDGAVRMALDAYEASIKENGEHGLINTIEHIETINPDDISRFKRLNVVASMQGEHLPLENNEKLSRVGVKRARYEWAHKSLLNAGATLAFGTDFPIVYLNQFPGIYAAVERKNYDGSQAGLPDVEKVSIDEALIANTLGSAKAYMRDYEIGSLDPGKLADLIVLDRNLFTVPKEEIKETKVVLTIMDGKIVYSA